MEYYNYYFHSILSFIIFSKKKILCPNPDGHQQLFAARLDLFTVRMDHYHQAFRKCNRRIASTGLHVLNFIHVTIFVYSIRTFTVWKVW